MTIQQIQYILQIYRTGSISKAAANLFLSQSNLSNSLRSLEQELGFPIFIRHNKGIEPTEEGFRVLEHAGHMWECYQSMLHVNSTEKTARFRLGTAPYTPVLESYSKLCIEYQEEPKLEFACQITDYHTLVEKLYLSLLDLGVMTIIPEEVEKIRTELASKNLAVNPIAHLPIALRIGPQHPLYRKAEIKLSDFSDYTFVDYQDYLFWKYAAVQSYVNLSPPLQSRTIIMPDRSSKSEIITKSHMYSIGCVLPSHLNQRYAFRNIPLGDMAFELVYIVHSRKPMTREISRFLDLLREELSSL